MSVLQEVLDHVATELEQEEELRAQHARDKKQVRSRVGPCT